MTHSELLKAICIDINWDLFWRSASPGLYSHADPKAQVRWCHELGANVMQTFCVSYNGYAWFPSEVAPVTPGLTGNFLQDQVEEGHRLGMKVLGYFCLGSNPYWAGNTSDAEWHDSRLLDPMNRPVTAINLKDADWNWLPFTNRYMDYFCASIQDALEKTGMDGFMIDWFNPHRGPVWLDCEKEMWRELLGEPFPQSLPSPEAELEFKRRQVDRAWGQVKAAVNGVRPAIIWTNHPFERADDPLWNGSRLLREVDWILNESPDLEFLNWLEKQIGPQTKLIQNFCGWPGHSAESWRDLDAERFGYYGFTCTHPGTCLPWTEGQIQSHRRQTMKPDYLKRVVSDTKNIAVLREAYHHLRNA